MLLLFALTAGHVAQEARACLCLGMLHEQHWHAASRAALAGQGCGPRAQDKAQARSSPPARAATIDPSSTVRPRVISRVLHRRGAESLRDSRIVFSCQNSPSKPTFVLERKKKNKLALS